MCLRSLDVCGLGLLIKIVVRLFILYSALIDLLTL